MMRFAPAASSTTVEQSARAATRPGVDAPPSRHVRVLIVIDHLGFAGGVIHGPGRLLLEQLPRFDRSLVEPSLCVLRPHHPMAERFRAIGVDPIFLGRAKWDPRVTTDLIRLVRRDAPDVLHLMGEKAMILGRIAARATGRRAIIHLRDTKSPRLAVRFLARRLAPCTDLALGCADAVTELAVRDWAIPRHKARTLLNGINVDRFASPDPGARERIRAELRIPPDAPLVGVVGRMAPEKGHDLLIRGMPLLRLRRPGTMLLIVGDGPTRAPCEALVRSLSLGDAVRFAGQRADIPDILAACDVIALPSRWGEGLPGVVIEAVAAGRPVVAFPVAGTVDVVIHERTGLIVPQDDGVAMASALARLLTDHDLRERLAANCREHARAFRVEENVRKLERIYLEVAGRAPPAADGTPHDAPRITQN